VKKNCSPEIQQPSHEDKTKRRISILGSDLVHSQGLKEDSINFRLLVESVKDYGIFMLDPDGYVQTWNEGAERIKGYSAAEIIGKHFSIFYTPDAVERGHPAHELEIAKEQGRYEEEYWRLRKDGSRFWASITITRLNDEAGKLIGFSKVTRDLSERKLAEESLRHVNEELEKRVQARTADLAASEEQFRLLANSISQLAWMAEPDGNIFWYNQQWYDYTGTTLEQMRGWGWQDVHDPKEFPRVAEQWKKTLASGIPADIEFPIKGADGKYRWFLTRWAALRDKDGKITRWFGTNTDIDEKRLIQSQLTGALKTRDELLSLSRIDLEKLRLEREMRERFVATLSHDLRNPLTAAKSAAELLLRYEDTLQSKRLASRIIANVDRADNMIQDLLDANQIRAGQSLPLKIVPCEIRSIITYTVEELTLIHGDRFLLRANSSIYGYWCEQSLRRVVENLANNAVKYGSHETAITISLTVVDQKVRIAVHNEGEALSPQDQAEMRFSQV
jgi:PAS domain S-box-containing protein